jgi:hypothetical protein
VITFLKNSYFNLFIILFIITGFYLSINTGITHDEFHDFLVFQANKNLFLNKILDTNYDTSYLFEGGKYYGSGFHYFSLIFEMTLSKLTYFDRYTFEIKSILIKHISVFFLFTISGLIFKKIIKIIMQDENTAKLSCILYLLYPYLLGHSFFNVKDIPFLSIWLVCTYLIVRITVNFYKENTILLKHFILISLFTGYLLSIRISGLLIFIEYLIFILSLTSFMKINIFKFILRFIKEIIFSVFLIIITFIFLQPSYWSDPFLIINAIKFMSQHHQTVCTITLGECMKAQNLPSSYLPIWLFFKLPIFVILSLLLYFFIEKKIDKQPAAYIILASISFSIIAIIFLLILLNVNLYDEIRQVMFLLPLVFIISLSFLKIFSKKIFNIICPLIIVFFLIQNIKVYPYNYIWINNFSHLTKVQGVFELDYWGVSTKNIAKFLNSKSIDKSSCIITNRNNGIKPFVNKERCFIEFNKLHKNNIRPFYVALMERSLKKGTPNNCKIIYEETRSINFSNEKLFLAKVFKCS